MSFADRRPELRFEVNFEDDALQTHPAYLESISPAPLAFWRLGEPSGTTAADEMGSFNGVYTGAIGLAQGSAFGTYGDRNTSASFDGASSYMQVGGSTTWQNLYSAWTLGAWMLPTTTPADNAPKTIVGVWPNTGHVGTRRPAFLNYGSFTAGTGMSGNKVWGGYYAGGAWGGEATVVSDPTAVTVGAWHFYVITWDGTTLNLYRNGVVVDTNTTGIANAAVAVASGVLVGYDVIQAATIFQGYLDEVFAFNYAIGADQVAQIYRYFTIAEPDEANYVDLSDRLRPMSIRRGRSDPVSRVEAGNLTVTLDNQDGLLNPAPIVNLLANPSFEATEEPYLPFTTTGGTQGTFPYGVLATPIADSGLVYGYAAATAGSGATMYVTSQRNGLIGMRPGKTYTFSAYVYSATGHFPAADVTLQIVDETSGSTQTTSSSALPGLDAWHRLSVTRTIRADADAAYVRIACADADAGKYINYDLVQLEENDTVTDYCDGDQDGCSWAGEQHTSMSRRLPDDAPGEITPMRRCRLIATWKSTDYGLFHGYIDRFAYTYPGMGTDAIVTLNVTDGTRILSNVSMNGFARSSERAGDRVRAILDWAGIPSTDYDVQDGYIDALALDSESVTSNVSALSLILEIEETERGTFFVSRDGLFTYQGNEYRSIEGVDQFFLDDQDEGVPYSDVAAIIDLATVVNDTKIENVANASTHEFVEPLSQQRYLTLSASEQSGWDTNAVSYLYRGEPYPLADSIEVRPLRDPDTLWPIMLGLELGALGRIERTRNGVDVFQGYLQFLEGLEHNIGVGNWTMNLRTSPTPVSPITSSTWQTPVSKPILKTSKYATGGGATVTMPSASYVAGRLYIVYAAMFRFGGGAPSTPTFTSANSWTNVGVNVTGAVGATTARHTAWYSVAGSTATETLQLNFATSADAFYDIVVLEISEGFNATPIGDVTNGGHGSSSSGSLDVGTLTDARSVTLIGVLKDANANINFTNAVELYDRHGPPTDSYAVGYASVPNTDTISFNWAGVANGWGAIAIEIEAT